jgi:hypothetical protein
MNDRLDNPYIRFVLGSPTRRRGDSGKTRALNVLDDAPGELRLLADYFVDLDYRSIVASLPSIFVASIIESDRVEIVDVARVLVVATERISREVEDVERRAKAADANAERRIRAAEKKVREAEEEAESARRSAAYWRSRVSKKTSKKKRRR